MFVQAPLRLADQILLSQFILLIISEPIGLYHCSNISSVDKQPLNVGAYKMFLKSLAKQPLNLHLFGMMDSLESVNDDMSC